jgi:hypothetical protein
MEQYTQSDESVNMGIYEGFTFSVLPIIIVGILLFCVGVL